MPGFDINRFPKPALIYFLAHFEHKNPALLRKEPRTNLLKLIQKNTGLQRQIQELVVKQPIFTDQKFLHAWRSAFFDFPECNKGCLKMRFYAMVVDEKGHIVVESVNRRMSEQFGRHRFCNHETCIRTSIPSRTDAAIGDCGHAPLWCLSKLWELGFKKQDLERLSIYEAGFKVADFSPWISDDINYTCLQCQNEFVIFGLRRIWAVKYLNGVAQWVALPTQENFYTVVRYAIGEKEADKLKVEQIAKMLKRA